MITKQGDWLEFRWFFKEELNEIVTILNQASPEKPVTKRQIRRFVERRDGNVVRVLVNEGKKEVAAVVIYSGRRNKIKIHRLVVKSSYRNQGVAKTMLARLRIRADLEILVSERDIRTCQLANRLKFNARPPILYRDKDEYGLIRMVLPKKIRRKTLQRV